MLDEIARQSSLEEVTFELRSGGQGGGNQVKVREKHSRQEQLVLRMEGTMSLMGLRTRPKTRKKVCKSEKRN